jgi:hypothetical protein
MMLESPVPRNWHAGFGGGYSEQYRSGGNSPDAYPTLSARSSWPWQIAVPIIRWDSSCVLLRHGSTFIIGSDPTRGWRTCLRSSMPNNMDYKLFLDLAPV